MNSNSSNNCFTEKEALHDALEAQKQITGMFNSYSNECANTEVRKVMLDILNDEHSIQFDVFNDMQKRGYYPVSPAQQDKVTKMKNTYSQQAGGGGMSGSSGSSANSSSSGNSGSSGSWSGAGDTTALHTPGGGMGNQRK